MWPEKTSLKGWPDSCGRCTFIPSGDTARNFREQRKKRPPKNYTTRPLIPPAREGRENSRHFSAPPLVSSWNDVWEARTEIPYWWRVTTQIWVMLLTGWSKNFPRCTTNQKHYPDLGSDASSVWNFGARFEEASGCFAKCGLFSQARLVVPWFEIPAWHRGSVRMVVLWLTFENKHWNNQSFKCWQCERPQIVYSYLEKGCRKFVKATIPKGNRKWSIHCS